MKESNQPSKGLNSNFVMKKNIWDPDSPIQEELKEENKETSQNCLMFDDYEDFMRPAVEEVHFELFESAPSEVLLTKSKFFKDNWNISNKRYAQKNQDLSSFIKEHMHQKEFQNSKETQKLILQEDSIQAMRRRKSINSHNNSFKSAIRDMPYSALKNSPTSKSRKMVTTGPVRFQNLQVQVPQSKLQSNFVNNFLKRNS